MATKAKTVCKFGTGCYRKNPKHLSEYYHPGDEEEKVGIMLWTVKKRSCSNSAFYVSDNRGI